MASSLALQNQASLIGYPHDSTPQASATTGKALASTLKLPPPIARAAPPKIDPTANTYTYPPINKALAQLTYFRRSSPDVWNKKADKIIDEVLRPAMPVFDLAVDLALKEYYCPLPLSRNSTPCKPRPSLTLLLLLLIRNWNLSYMARDAMNTWLKSLDKYNYRSTLSFTPFEDSYFVIRQFVWAYHRSPEEQVALRSKLNQIPKKSLRTHYEMCLFMLLFMEYKDQAPHGMPKDEEDWTVEDETSYNANKDEWKFALEEIVEVFHANI